MLNNGGTSVPLAKLTNTIHMKKFKRKGGLWDSLMWFIVGLMPTRTVEFDKWTIKMKSFGKRWKHVDAIEKK